MHDIEETVTFPGCIHMPTLAIWYLIENVDSLVGILLDKEPSMLNWMLHDSIFH